MLSRASVIRLGRGRGQAEGGDLTSVSGLILTDFSGTPELCGGLRKKLQSATEQRYFSFRGLVSSVFKNFSSIVTEKIV